MSNPDIDDNVPHIVLIGGGIMSATLGVLLKRLEPRFTIDIFERLDTLAAESSDAWNNAGTGHSAFCELNYTPPRADGSVHCKKAVAICEAFEVSRQFWAALVEQGALPDPTAFIRTVPHHCFVRGAADVAFLKRRHAAMSALHPFSSMAYSEDPEVLRGWMPLVMEGRDPHEPVAATRVEHGTDVDFGVLARSLFAWLHAQEGVTVHRQHEVRGITREAHAPWLLSVVDLATYESREVAANFVFIGAGGGALPLLEESGIPEGRGFGGFPVSGVWFVCLNPDVIAAHDAKVYGMAAIGAPPMSVPHLDTRVIDGKKALLFGPFAGFSTRFLKHGSVLDLPLSINLDNVFPMLAAGMDNLPLTRYLVEQVIQSTEAKLDYLHTFYPAARMEDWEVRVAGQRVQIIRKDEAEGGVLQFGTEVVTSQDGTLAALLGASPGASTAASILLELIERCFQADLATEAWQARLRELIPSYGQSITSSPALCDATRATTDRVLRLRPGLPRRPLDVVRAWLRAIERGEDHVVEALAAPDLIQIEHPNALNPSGGRSDRSAVLARLARGRTALTSQRYEVHSTVVAGDRVAVELSFSAVVAIPLLGRAPGDTLRARLACFFTVRDGQIVEQTNYDCFEPV